MVLCFFEMKSNNISINMLHDVYYTKYTILSILYLWQISISVLAHRVYFIKPTSHDPLYTVCFLQPTSLLGPFVPPVSNFGSGNYSELSGNEAAVSNISLSLSLFFFAVVYGEQVSDSYSNIRQTHRRTETHFMLLLA